ncbi:MAG: MFS transporter [Paraclostridium sp.]
MKIKEELFMQLNLFKVLGFTLYFTISTIGAMLVPFLQYKGYDPGQIGILISLYTVSGVIGQLLTGFFCDKLCTVKKIFLPSLCILALSMTLAISFNIKMIFLFGFLVSGFLQYILIALYDSWVIEYGKDGKEKFGKIRMFGSIGWAIGVLIIGYIMSKLGYLYVNIIYVVGIITCILSSIKLQDINKRGDKKCIKLCNLKSIIKNKEYMLIVITLLIIEIPLRAYYQLAPYVIESLGKGTEQFGIFSFICSISEIITLYLTVKVFKKVSPDRFLKVAPVAILLKLIIIYIAPNVFIVYLSGILQIFTYPVILMVGKILIDRICPQELKTSSQLMGFAIFNSLGIVIASLITGYLIDNLGLKLSIVSFMGISIAGVIISVYCDRKIKDKTM